MQQTMQGFSLLYPENYTREQKDLHRMKNTDFIAPLQIDRMIILQQDYYRNIPMPPLADFFTTDERVLAYRLDIVEELLQTPALYDIFQQSIPMIQNIYDLRRSMSSDFSVESSLGCIRILEMYVELVTLFSSAGANVKVHSVGLCRFFDFVRKIAQDDEFISLKTDLSGMETNFGTLKSITVGVNLDETLRVRDAGVLSINTQPYHAGSLMDKLLQRSSKDPYALMTPLFPLQKGLHGEELRVFNSGIRSALNTVFMKSLRDFEPVIQKYFAVNTAFFVQLLDDIRFLQAGVSFLMELKKFGVTLCKPVAVPLSEQCCTLEDVVNPMLALRGVEDLLVSNRFCFDENARFYLVTGPNHGGKSIFAYAVGMAQALFQLGLFVPAASARISPVTGIFTHFPASDEDNYGKGRLESECARLGDILKELEATDMLLMDESFSSTSGLEAGYIASEVLTGIGIIGCGGIYVTHIHDLPVRVSEYNSHPENRGKIDNLVAQMKDKENGVRSYRIERTTPDGLSYARDIAKQYGLNLDSILER